MTTGIAASVVVLAYGAEPTLERCIKAVRSSDLPELEIIVVDNGSNPEVVSRVRQMDGVTVLGPPENRGFAGGCNEGVRASRGEVVVLLNSDAFVSPTAVSRLVAAAKLPGTGIASSALMLDEEPHLLNSAGNPVHFSGLCWAGRYGEPLSAVPSEIHDIPTASGAALAIRRKLWDQLGGFDKEYFAYVEDTDLSIRCWQLGERVVFVPDAEVRHAYEFSRNKLKFYLLERNRLLFVLTTYQLKTLLLLAPALVAVELAMIVQALGGGWLGCKFKGYGWLLQNWKHVRRRRAHIQARRKRTDKDLSWLYSGKVEPANVSPPPGMSVFNSMLNAYWKFAQRLI